MNGLDGNSAIKTTAKSVEAEKWPQVNAVLGYRKSIALYGKMSMLLIIILK